MPIPLRVPVLYAYNKLNESARGFSRIVHVDRARLDDMAPDGVIQVTLLKPFFANHQAYLQFKRQIQVPHRRWQEVVNSTNNPKVRAYAMRQMRVNPSRSTSSSPRGSAHASPRASPRRSRSPSPVRRTPRYRKGQLNMDAFLGDISEDEYGDTPLSVLAIRTAGDECDDTDVNLPLPACQAINKVCRNYNKFRQYMPKRPDGTESKKYAIKVKTKFPR